MHSLSPGLLTFNSDNERFSRYRATAWKPVGMMESKSFSCDQIFFMCENMLTFEYAFGYTDIIFVPKVLAER